MQEIYIGYNKNRVFEDPGFSVNEFYSYQAILKKIS